MSAPSAPRLRQVLALFLARENQTVTRDAVISEMWGESPPRTAVATVQTYVYQLRRGALYAEELITRPGGYVLIVPEGALDLHHFEALAAEGETLLRRGRTREAAGRLGQALDLWKGEPLSDTPKGPTLSAYAAALQERRRQVLMQRINADMLCGDDYRVIGELRMLIQADPYNEWYHEQLIKALFRSGRRWDALQSYQELERLLSDELDLPPSDRLRRLYAEFLGGGHIRRVG
ncbi:DNA-binding SARP family transcriptional activator [Spinactinospora alkalitolerans]|uniref:DNA-binding SARP family transcriptional activator n=1 Tax=Spinactinospora alkalitolerans TaxID=687207 RepID=A0A852TTE2_9ACTN|nr:AfsR/SARP family transcriptional regulator [Spinactinospora alkalitolerans]NYE45384.1 DNA-binding SARP family transcriptional activator [Spinactinospora alkalitolerans]